MPSSASDLVKLELQVTGENDSTWGTKANILFERLEQAVAGQRVVTLATAASYTLDDTQYVKGSGATAESHYALLKLAGTPGASRNVVVPSRTKPYLINNTCTTAGVITTATGSGVTVNASQKAIVFCDGTDVIKIIATDDSPTSPVAVASGGTGATTATGAASVLGLAIGVDVQAYDADILKADTTDALTAGFSATPYNAGTKSSGTFTPDEANGNMQYVVNDGAHALAPPTNNCSIVLQYTNATGAGTITSTAFTKVSGSFATTVGNDYMCNLIKLNGFSVLQVIALQ